jgi:hypothetical protein
MKMKKVLWILAGVVLVFAIIFSPGAVLEAIPGMLATSFVFGTFWFIRFLRRK